MKAFDDSRENSSRELASSFSRRRSGPQRAGRAQPNRYPDFELEPRSRLPGRFRTSGNWEFVVRYSGVTVLDSHEVPRRLFAKRTFKERSDFILIARAIAIEIA